MTHRQGRTNWLCSVFYPQGSPPPGGWSQGSSGSGSAPLAKWASWPDSGSGSGSSGGGAFHSPHFQQQQQQQQQQQHQAGGGGGGGGGGGAAAAAAAPAIAAPVAVARPRMTSDQSDGSAGSLGSLRCASHLAPQKPYCSTVAQHAPPHTSLLSTLRAARCVHR
eukprot:COSAG06_NODE_10617_length_1648_cov_1.302776_2_plen_164_part_00